MRQAGSRVPAQGLGAKGLTTTGVIIAVLLVVARHALHTIGARMLIHAAEAKQRHEG